MYAFKNIITRHNLPTVTKFVKFYKESISICVKYCNL